MIKDILININADLQMMEMQKEALASAVQNQRHPTEILNPHGYQKLSDSKIWSKTEAEEKAFRDFALKVQGYNPYNNIQRKVIKFGKTINQKYRSFTADGDREELEIYINASRYWEKKTVTVIASDKKQLKVVFALNKDMQCIIFEYLGFMIISTMSSFDNYLRDIEGKSTEIPQKKRMKRSIWKPSKLYEALEPPEDTTMMVARRLEKEYKNG